MVDIRLPTNYYSSFLLLGIFVIFIFLLL